MNDTELIDRCRLKALLRNGYDLGLIQTMEDVEAYIDKRQVNDLARWPDWQHGKPPEHESIFYKFKGTDKWRPGMFEMTSGEVLVTIEVPGGRRYVVTDCTIDGKWRGDLHTTGRKVLAWAKLPEPYGGK